MLAETVGWSTGAPALSSSFALGSKQMSSQMAFCCSGFSAANGALKRFADSLNERLVALSRRHGLA